MLFSEIIYLKQKTRYGAYRGSYNEICEAIKKSRDTSEFSELIKKQLTAFNSHKRVNTASEVFGKKKTENVTVPRYHV